MMQENQSTIPLPSAMKPTETQLSPTNPLTPFFRHANTIISLPSNGKFWPTGTLVLSEQNTLEVYPMTAKDEIIMKSPDGLLSGMSIVETIASCVPGIKNPWKMPGIDLDTILIAIRLASYGPDLEITSVCTHCQAKNDNVVDLRNLLDNVPNGPVNNVVTIGKLTLVLQPYDYEFVNQVNRNTFEEQQLIRSVNNGTMSVEEKTAFFESTFKKLAKHTIESIVTAIITVTLPDGTEVTDRENIIQYFQNCDRKTFNDTKNKIIALSDNTQYPPVTIKCETCEKTYTTNLQFDQSNFFE